MKTHQPRVVSVVIGASFRSGTRRHARRMMHDDLGGRRVSRGTRCKHLHTHTLGANVFSVSVVSSHACRGGSRPPATRSHGGTHPEVTHRYQSMGLKKSSSPNDARGP